MLSRAVTATEIVTRMALQIVTSNTESHRLTRLIGANLGVIFEEALVCVRKESRNSSCRGEWNVEVEIFFF